MVVMKEVLPQCGPFFIAAFRLIPAGFLLVGFAASRGRPFPSGFKAWLSISLFALVDAACFQGFLAEGLQRTSVGLGSVIIDSQPLTVAVLAALLFRESIGIFGAAPHSRNKSAHCHGSAGKQLSKLVAFVKSTQFDLVEYLQRERYGSARLENFASGLELISQKA